MLCIRALLVCVVSMKKSSNPSVSRGSCCSLAIPGEGCLTLLLPPFVARASCCACELHPWFSRVGGPVCTTSPYVSHLRKD